ncbi:MAG: cytochrome c biogenesis protein CcdA [Candidatus Sericytochromatia bacterium]|nr:cytochrome c biogenesis protein CcdA [Candidatus Sericytochromatia bacterium]
MAEAHTLTAIPAFVAGLLSFLSPCVLPLIPGYLSFISGVSFEEVSADTGAGAARIKVMGNALLFVLGFSIIFILLGATATTLGQYLNTKLDLLAKIAGAVIIVFGLHVMGVFTLTSLYREKRIHLQKKPLGVFGAVLAGMAFAFGWTPCIGPILAGILAYAATSDTLWQGVWLLSVYSMGLAIPFLIAAWGLKYFYKAFDRIKRHMGLINKASGLLLILVGLLMVTNNLTWLASKFAFLNGFGL